MRIPTVGIATLVLGLATGLNAAAQQGRGGSGGNSNSNNKGDGQNTTQMQTVRGVIAGVTAEGETVFDHKANRAVTVEAAYITVIGSPRMDGQNADRARNGGDRGRDNSSNNGNNSTKSSNNANSNNNGGNSANNNSNNTAGGSDRRRDNIYIVWLTPKTKVAEQYFDAEGRKATVRDTTFDKVEVGDRVEIQFMPREGSQSNVNATQNDNARMKHGRHRTFVGDANWITILPARNEGQRGGSSGNDSSRGGASDSSKSGTNDSSKSGTNDSSKSGSSDNSKDK